MKPTIKDVFGEDTEEVICYIDENKFKLYKISRLGETTVVDTKLDIETDFKLKDICGELDIDYDND